jgi:hypothetical protein
MVAGAIAGNISGEATTPTGNTFVEATRGMLLITTEQIRTWREEVLVLSPARYEIVDRFIQNKILQPDCKDMRNFRLDPPYANRISLTERNADRSQACVIPPGESCDSLSELLDLSDVNWTETEMQSIRHVRAELNFKDYPRQSP